jgi:hypothetical protein
MLRWVQQITHALGVPAAHFTLNLYTLGYQGVDVDTYVQKLKTAGVGVVADVRETPCRARERIGSAIGN